MNRHIIVIVLLFVFSETAIGMAQGKLTNESNFVNSNRQSIITSYINTNNSPVIDITNDAFWEIFGPLVKQSFNRSVVSSTN
ncbi:MAG TPA: hypothetical protein VE130_07975 [Nitrososphaeraceae archaeon]|jgi:hypothetical protein|nr:hypothetical protein [Nitrososphaeraceae archaeon]